MIKFVLLSFAISAVQCQYQTNKASQKREEGFEEGAEEYIEPHYRFEYSVNDTDTKDIKSHKEERHGEKTRGEYAFVESDGALRTVKYSVEGKSGFIAEVYREPGRMETASEPSQKATSEPSQEPAAEPSQEPAAEPSQEPAVEPSYYKTQLSSYELQPRNNRLSVNNYKSQPSYNKQQVNYYKVQPSYYRTPSSYDMTQRRYNKPNSNFHPYLSTSH